MTTSDQHLDEPNERPVDVAVARSRPVVSLGVGGPVAGRSVGEIRALCDAATPGPWRVEIEGGVDISGEGWCQVEVGFVGALDAVPGHEPGLVLGDHENAEADAAFIAAARELVPALLAEVEAAHRFEVQSTRESAEVYDTVTRMVDELASLRSTVHAVDVAVRDLPKNLHIAGDDAAAHNWNAAVSLAQTRLRAALAAAVPSQPEPDDESWSCSHVPRCADAACSDNPAMKRWVAGPSPAVLPEPGKASE